MPSLAGPTAVASRQPDWEKGPVAARRPMSKSRHRSRRAPTAASVPSSPDSLNCGPRGPLLDSHSARRPSVQHAGSGSETELESPPSASPPSQDLIDLSQHDDDDADTTSRLQLTRQPSLSPISPHVLAKDGRRHLRRGGRKRRAQQAPTFRPPSVARPSSTGQRVANTSSTKPKPWPSKRQRVDHRVRLRAAGSNMSSSVPPPLPSPSTPPRPTASSSSSSSSSAVVVDLTSPDSDVVVLGSRQAVPPATSSSGARASRRRHRGMMEDIPDLYASPPRPPQPRSWRRAPPRGPPPPPPTAPPAHNAGGSRFPGYVGPSSSPYSDSGRTRPSYSHNGPTGVTRSGQRFYSAGQPGPHRDPVHAWLGIMRRMVASPHRPIAQMLADALMPGGVQGFHHIGLPRNAHMQPDVDRMSYEQLLALSERLGQVKPQGASASTISRMPVSEYNGKGSDSCTICLTDFKKGEKVKTLPCFHIFHTSCIDDWLPISGTCPVCKHSIRK